MKIDDRLREQFAEQGFIGPFPMLNKEECAEVFSRTRNSPRPPIWSKANAVSSSVFYQVATRADLLEIVRAFLGEDVLLWGASLVRKEAGSVHPWHSDVECSGDAGKALTVWIGLEKTNRQSALQLLSYSHRFGKSLQEVAYEAGKDRSIVQTEDVLQWAQQRDSRSRVENFDVRDGDALLFDGRLWHYSENNNASGTRTALLLQYATPDARIRVRSKGEYGWPLRFSEERPPCIVVSGIDRFGVNQTVPPPAMDPLWPCWIRTMDTLPLETKGEGWKSGHIFKGPTGVMKKLSTHFSILDEGKIPHAPHAHSEEEMLIVLDGHVDIIRVDDREAQSTERLGPGFFVYHAAYQRHTIHSAGPGPATYLMFKWKGKSKADGGEVLKSSTFHIWSGKEKERPGSRRIGIFQSPTLYLNSLRSHLSILEPGAGYPPHADPYDVAIIVMNGNVETLGSQVGPGSVIFYPANEPHGLSNPGTTKATYLVFEFHGSDGK